MSIAKQWSGTMSKKSDRRILMHICCAPCTIYPLSRLRDSGWEVFGYFYNLNIHPYQEFQRRLKTLEEYAKMVELRLIKRDEYDVEHFIRQVVFRETKRCYYCYAHRLEAAAKLAKKSGFHAFTTTLLYSKQQKHDLIKEIAEGISRRAGIPFYYEDFREGWNFGIEKSIELGLYRQQYCGCIYSEAERFVRSGSGHGSRGAVKPKAGEPQPNKKGRCG